MKHTQKAFTMMEMVVVVIIIGILMLGMTIYLNGTGERANKIEAEGCANSLGGIIDNYLYYTLTSKNLTVGEDSISPKYYTIGLGDPSNSNSTKCNANNPCKKLIVGYISGDDNTHLYNYGEYTPYNTCSHSKINLGFYRNSEGDGSYNINKKYVRMNKGFFSYGTTDQPFQIKDNGSYKLIEDIIIVICTSEDCTPEYQKQIGKWKIDARSQTISLSKCKFYSDDELNICGERQD